MGGGGGQEEGGSVFSMIDLNLVLLLSGVVAGAAPILLATLGETITEKAGFINLSLDGTILLGAMTAFVVAFETGSALSALPRPVESVLLWPLS